MSIIKTEYRQPFPFPTVTFCPGLFSKELGHLIENSSRVGYDPAINTDFELFKSEERGICFRFNSGKNMSNHSIPIKYSIIGGKDDCFKLVLKEKKDLTIWIHERKSPPKIEEWNNHDSPINIMGGSKVFIEIEKSKNSMLGEPYNHCFRDGSSFEGNRTIIDYILSIDQIYRQRNCLEVCFDLFYLQENPCNCTNTSLGNVWKDCFIFKEKGKIDKCTFQKRTQFYRNNLIEKCSEYCPLECDSVSYSVSINALPYNTSFTTIKIYYKSLQYTSIMQEPKMKMFDFISNVGSILGLFIGMSFVNLFEIIEIFFEIGFVLFKRFKLSTTIVPKHENENSFFKDLIQKEITDAFEKRINTIINEKITKHENKMCLILDELDKEKS